MKNKKTWGQPCPKCKENVEMYYIAYCPKCDIQEIIKHKRGFCLMPILSYGYKYIKGFTRRIVWDELCQNISGNDTYFEYSLDEIEGVDNTVVSLMKQVLDELNIDYKKDNNEILFWVSW